MPRNTTYVIACGDFYVEIPDCYVDENDRIWPTVLDFDVGRPVDAYVKLGPHHEPIPDGATILDVGDAPKPSRLDFRWRYALTH